MQDDVKEGGLRDGIGDTLSFASYIRNCVLMIGKFEWSKVAQLSNQYFRLSNLVLASDEYVQAISEQNQVIDSANSVLLADNARLEQEIAELQRQVKVAKRARDQSTQKMLKHLMADNSLSRQQRDAIISKCNVQIDSVDFADLDQLSAAISEKLESDTNSFSYGSVDEMQRKLSRIESDTEEYKQIFAMFFEMTNAKQRCVDKLDGKTSAFNQSK